MKVKVLDALMGTGKTHYFINKIKNDTEGKYIYITPFLDEVKRIKQSCYPEKLMKSPVNRGNGKLDDLHNLLVYGHSIVSTHALFLMFNETTVELIRAGGYTLILDEVCDVIREIDLTEDDFKLLIETEKVRVNKNAKIEWIGGTYSGELDGIKEEIETNNIVKFGNKFFWLFPHSVLDSFVEVYIATFMFKAQIQKYYFDINNVEFEYVDFKPRKVDPFWDRINILEKESLNRVGEKRTALSMTWYRTNSNTKKSMEMIRLLKRNVYNAFHNYFKSFTNENNLCASFKDFEHALWGKGYKNSFIPFNSRATNKFRNRSNLAYCVNIFLKPEIKNFFFQRGVIVLEEDYALSEMIQWIWRSAIRDGKEINIYIPSSRMRNLFKFWIEEYKSVQSGLHCVEEEVDIQKRTGEFKTKHVAEKGTEIQFFKSGGKNIEHEGVRVVVTENTKDHKIDLYGMAGNATVKYFTKENV